MPTIAWHWVAVRNSFQGKQKPVTEMIAYCGLTCQTCPIYLATRQKEKEEQTRMRVEIVRLCKEHYGMDYDVKDITDCDGCVTEGGRRFSACKNCLIRKCARENELENCAHCTEYICEKLGEFFKTEPTTRTCLDEIRCRILKIDR